MSCFRLMTRNYVNEDLLADYTVSSENTNFPLSNSFSPNRRSRVWRTTGYFKIESGSNTIIFTEGGGNLTATITPGEYTAATLCTAIDAAFTAGGAGSYTVTYTAAFKFQIVKSAGTFTIKWTNGSSAAMAAILGFSTAADDTGSLTYLSDNFRIHTSEWAVFDMGVSSSPSTFIIAGNRNEPIKLSNTAVITLKGNDTNVWTSPTFSATIPYDEEAICLFSDTSFGGTPLRYWKLEIVDQNPLGYLEIGVVYLGEHFEGASGSVQFPLKVDLIDYSENMVSEGRQTLADVFEQTAVYTADWNFLDKNDIEDITEFFEDVGLALPFFVSMDTPAYFSTSFNRRVKYVKFSDSVSYSLDGADRFSCTMNFREEL